MSNLTKPISDEDHIRGNKAASVTLLEYGDYECPYCGEAYVMLKELKQRIGNQYEFVFRNFPLSQIHPHAKQAAYAAEAAGLQGKYWEMHDMLFENQDALEESDLASYAQALDLDLDKFTADMQSNTVIEKVENDFMGGVRSGVNGTPTFFINGTRYDGEDDVESLQEAIESASQHTSHSSRSV